MSAYIKPAQNKKFLKYWQTGKYTKKSKEKWIMGAGGTHLQGKIRRTKYI